MDLWTQSQWHKHQESQAGIHARHLQLDYEQGKALFSMNNSLHNPIKSSHALHKNTFPIFLIRAYRVLAQPTLAQVKKKPNFCLPIAAGCKDIDDRKSSWRMCITAGNDLGEACPLTTHHLLLYSPLSHSLAHTHRHTHTARLV